MSRGFFRFVSLYHWARYLCVQFDSSFHNNNSDYESYNENRQQRKWTLTSKLRPIVWLKDWSSSSQQWSMNVVGSLCTGGSIHPFLIFCVLKGASDYRGYTASKVVSCSSFLTTDLHFITKRQNERTRESVLYSGFSHSQIIAWSLKSAPQLTWQI